MSSEFDKTNPFEKFVGKRVKIFQKDKYIKDGLCRGYNERFIFLEFNDGTPVAISFDKIDEIKFWEEEK